MPERTKSTRTFEYDGPLPGSLRVAVPMAAVALPAVIMVGGICV